MKRLLIPLFTAMLLLMVGTIAMAEGEPPDQVILTQVTGVPATMTVSFKLDGQDVAIIKGDQIIHKQAFPASQKSFIKIRLEGEGKLTGARFDFQPNIAAIVPPEKPVEEPIIEERVPVEEINNPEDIVVSPNEEPAEIIEAELVGNPAEPEVVELEDIIESEPTETPVEVVAENLSGSEPTTEPSDTTTGAIVSDDSSDDTTSDVGTEPSIAGE